MANELKSNTKLDKQTAEKASDILNQLRVVLNHDKTIIGPTEEQRDFCLVKKSYFLIQISEIDNDVEKIQQTATQWKYLIDEKTRQLYASDPVISELDREISFFKGEIAEISNEFQSRHDARSTQICEIVVARQSIETDQGLLNILPAILPGPNQTPTITENIVYRQFTCDAPKYTRNEVTIPEGTPCVHPPLGLGGRKPLDDKYADQSGALDCAPLKVVDINTTI